MSNYHHHHHLCIDIIQFHSLIHLRPAFFKLCFIQIFMMSCKLQAANLESFSYTFGQFMNHAVGGSSFRLYVLGLPAAVFILAAALELRSPSLSCVSRKMGMDISSFSQFNGLLLSPQAEAAFVRLAYVTSGHSLNRIFFPSPANLDLGRRFFPFVFVCLCLCVPFLFFFCGLCCCTCSN
ncbi:hypothetical protein CPC08DRAFT_95823 [Agrocybe pediades]|nr:hypothetical protein CPC08DRAFT_95823 [Agrocybe pediades]